MKRTGALNLTKIRHTCSNQANIKGSYEGAKTFDGLQSRASYSAYEKPPNTGAYMRKQAHVVSGM